MTLPGLGAGGFGFSSPSTAITGPQQTSFNNVFEPFKASGGGNSLLLWGGAAVLAYWLWKEFKK